MSQPIFDSMNQILHGRGGAQPLFERKTVFEDIYQHADFVKHPTHGGIIRRNDLQKALHVPYDWNFDPKTIVPSTSFTSATSVDFEIRSAPNYYSEDPDSLWLEINVTETGGSNTVTPTFVENLFDEIKGVEYMVDGVTFYQVPVYQTLLSPAMIYSNTEYAAMCNVLNHSAVLAHDSGTAIAASGTAQYFLRLPSPLPSTGFWWGALREKALTIRLNTATGGGVSAGSGTLACTSMKLHIMVHVLPSDELPALDKIWQSITWRKYFVIVNKPNAITTSSTGDSPKVKLENFRDVEGIFAVTWVRASRATASGAWINLTAPAAGAKVRIESKEGTSIFTPGSGFPYNYLKYVYGPKHMRDSKIFTDTSMVPTFIDSDTQKFFGISSMQASVSQEMKF